jgi:solute carrier family 25 iron transporter 28/37
MALAQQKLDSRELETTVQLQQQEPAFSNTSSSAVAKLQVQGDTPTMEEVDYESLPTERLSVHLCAGAAAGMMEHCAMYPVDCVKVRRILIGRNRYK